MAQTIKNLPTIQEIQVQSLGWEDSLGERNGYSLQYSCLENPIDRGAWRATVHVRMVLSASKPSKHVQTSYWKQGQSGHTEEVTSGQSWLCLPL